MKFLQKALIATGALAMSSGAALAATAIAAAPLTVRSGPGSNYGVIDRVPPGERLNLLGCGSTWCEISMGGDGTGFVLASRLDRVGRSRVVIDEEPAIIGLSIGGYWDSRPYYVRDGYYYWGGRWYGDRPGRPGWRDRSWRRWEERREARRDWREDRRDRWEDRRERRAERRDDFRDRFDNRGDDRRGRSDDRGEARVERRDGVTGLGNTVQRPSNDDRRARIDDRSGDRRDQRMENRTERTENRAERSERSESRSGVTGLGNTAPQRPSNDGGDRVGLDRAGSGGGAGMRGGAGNDGGGAGRGGDRN